MAVVEFLQHGMYPAPGRNLRNEVMAENLLWLLHRDPDARILVGAHNVHVRRSPSVDGSGPIGALLADELGDDMVVIGGTRGTATIPDTALTAAPSQRFFLPDGDHRPAPAHTRDALLDSVGTPMLFAHLRRTDLDAVTAIQGAYGMNVDIDLGRRSTP
ncbi:hypothetical protein AOZ06_28075 [Kibdelosporangium phytohabitans]|uniref:Erythromycin esterase n=1 Tax=Kibdelosporangium phytohabitans TaxID=860235 RepID=A0A0N9HSP7_9PSEU|nr:hypothetical protein AOZ06_28075 [Kibdelosporangium phytohabitans]